MIEYTKEIADLIELKRQRHNEYWDFYISQPLLDRTADSEAEIQRLKSEEDKVQKIITNELSEFYCNIAITIRPKDICFQYIFDDSKTTQILDNFKNASEDVMLLRDVFKTNQGQWISLIITEYDWNLELGRGKAPTMTEIKESIGRYPNDYYPGRLIHLIEEIYDVVDEDAYYPKKTRFALNIPCVINGQDSRLRDTYGDTWSYMVIGVEVTN